MSGLPCHVSTGRTAQKPTRVEMSGREEKRVHARGGRGMAGIGPENVMMMR